MSKEKFPQPPTGSISQAEWEQSYAEAHRRVFKKYSKMLKSELVLNGNHIYIKKPLGFYDSQKLLDDAKTLGITDEDLQKQAYWNHEFAGDNLPDGETVVPRTYSREELIDRIIQNKIAGDCMDEQDKITGGRKPSIK